MENIMDDKNYYYRRYMNKDRFRYLNIKYKEIDIQIGLSLKDKNVKMEDIKKFIEGKLRHLRDSFQDYISSDPQFLKSLKPIDMDKIKAKRIFNTAYGLMEDLEKYAWKTGIGPMGGIAGAFAEYLLTQLDAKYICEEIIIENGGDCYFKIENDIKILLHAPISFFNEKVIIKVDKSIESLGLSSSSGRYGHSKNFGRSDILLVCCKDPVLSDFWATALSNRIQNTEDMTDIVNNAIEDEEILFILGGINETLSYNSNSQYIQVEFA